MKQFRTSKVLLPALAGCAFGAVLASCANAQQPGENIALGKSATFSAPPNYSLSTDADDNKQLTDGQYSSEGKLNEVENTTSIWVQKGTVGWSNRSPIFITIDLGSVQPISGFSYSTAAGRAGVAWPSTVLVAVSDDNKTWRDAGDLVELSRKNGAPPAEGYATFRYATRDLKTRGRYVTVVVAAAPYIFTDEIEIYAGDKQWLNEPLAGATFTGTEGLKERALQSMTAVGARRRLKSDAGAVRELVQESALPAPRKSALMARLDAAQAAADTLKTLPADFKAILPLNDSHRDTFAVYGELLAAQGVKPLTVWKQHRYDWLPLLATPSRAQKNELNFSMLKNQFRSDALLLTNASTSPQTMTLRLANAPQNAQPGWLKVDAVEWTDTYEGNVVADALLPVAEKNGAYSVTVPAGMTRKVWFTVDSSKLAPGRAGSTLEVSGGGAQLQVPVTLDVSAIAMSKPRLSLGMWDYTDGQGYGGITPQNRDAAIAMMRSHYVDTPWATGAALPMPGANAFDSQNNLTGKLNFSRLDEWIARWPGAKGYFVFPSVGESFAGEKMGTPAFNARVGSWARVLASHMKELGLQPQQLGILLVDEPRNDAQDAIIAAWAKAINAAAPELTLFEDPVWARPDQTKIQDAITEIDILSPQLPIYYRAGKPVQEYFAGLREQGKDLWFYSCTGPIRPYDPQTYFRYQAWHTFSIGGTGQGFWAFCDNGGAPSSFNEYAAGGVNFAPAFLDKNTVYSSLHWDAVREGMEDFEELAMLRDAISASKNPALKAQAQRVLNDAVQAVTATWKDEADLYSWSAQKYNPQLADEQLKNVRAMLKKLKA
jgi:hypothetical protein